MSLSFKFMLGFYFQLINENREELKQVSIFDRIQLKHISSLSIQTTIPAASLSLTLMLSNRMPQ